MFDQGIPKRPSFQDYKSAVQKMGIQTNSEEVKSKNPFLQALTKKDQEAETDVQETEMDVYKPESRPSLDITPLKSSMKAKEGPKANEAYEQFKQTNRSAKSPDLTFENTEEVVKPSEQAKGSEKPMVFAGQEQTKANPNLERFQAANQGLANTDTPTNEADYSVKRQEKPFDPFREDPIDNPWWEDLWDGVSVGWKDMKANVAGGIAELADMAPSISATAPTIGENYAMNPNARKFENFSTEYSKELEKQQKGLSKPALPTFREFARREHEKAKQRGEGVDTDSWGYFIGSLIPQTAGIATAVVASAFNPAAGAAIGLASTGSMGLMGIGAAANEYDEYVKAKNEMLIDELGRRFPGSITPNGEINYNNIPEDAREWAKLKEFNPNEKLGAMLLSYAIETGSEAIPLAKFLPTTFTGKLGKLVFGNNDVLNKQASELLEEFANSNASRLQQVKNATREAAEGGVTEGLTESVAELGGEFSTWLYKEKEDRADWKELTESTAKGFLGGMFMGSSIGPLSYGSQLYQNKKRREENGKVVLSQDKETGELVEILGISNPNEEGVNPENEAAIYQAVRPNGKVYEVSEDNLNEVFEYSLNEFNAILKGKEIGSAAQEQNVNEELANEALNQIEQVRQQYEPFSFTDPLGNKSIVVGSLNGDQVFVNQTTDEGYIITTDNGEKKVVSKAALQDVQSMPFDEFINQVSPVREDVKTPFDSERPIIKGEEINFEGEKWLVTGVDIDSGSVQLELAEGEGAVFETISVEDFQTLRGPKIEPVQEKPTQEKLRKIFGKGNAGNKDNEPGNLSGKPGDNNSPGEKPGINKDGGEKPGIKGPNIEIQGAVGQTVKYQGRTGTLQQAENGQFEILSGNTVFELPSEVTASSLTGDLGIEVLPQQEARKQSEKPKTKPNSIEFSRNEKTVNVDGQEYTVNTNELGNIASLSFTNEQGEKRTTRDPNLILSVEIERNKTAYFANPSANKVQDLKTEIANDQGNDADSNIIEQVDRMLSLNMTEAVEKFLDGEQANEGDLLQARLWLEDAIQRVETFQSENGQSENQYLNNLKDNLYEAYNTITAEAEGNVQGTNDDQQPTGAVPGENITGSKQEGEVSKPVSGKFPKISTPSGVIEGTYESHINAAKKAVQDPDMKSSIRILSNGPYQAAIYRGEITAQQAKEVIETAGLPVPQDILNKISSKPIQNENENVPTKDEQDGQQDGQKDGLQPTKDGEEVEGNNPEANRKRGYFIDGTGTRRDRPNQLNVPEGKTEDVKFADKVTEKAVYTVMDAKDLNPSHIDGLRNPLHFIPEAQPKDRRDQASLDAVQRIANNLNPKEVSTSTNAYSGSPVVNSRGEVIQGNNRSNALLTYWKQNGQNDPQGYKQYLIDNAAEFGLNPSDIEGIQNPVLVRMARVADARAIELGNYDVKDIESGGSRRIDPKQTLGKLNQQARNRIISLISKGQGKTPSEIIRDQYSKILDILYKSNAINSTQLQGMVNQDGAITKTGVEDLTNLFMEFLFEGGSPDLQRAFNGLPAKVQNGIQKALPNILRAKNPIVSEIQDAILALNQFQEFNGTFNEWVNQMDAFAPNPVDVYGQLPIEIARNFDSLNQNAIAELFNEYYRLTADTPADMFSAAKPGISQKEAIEKIFNVKDYESKSDRPGEKVLDPKPDNSNLPNEGVQGGKRSEQKDGDPTKISGIGDILGNDKGSKGSTDKPNTKPESPGGKGVDNVPGKDLTPKTPSIKKIDDVLKPSEKPKPQRNREMVVRQGRAKTKDGKGIMPGDTFVTNTGRETTPYPKYSFNRPTKADTKKASEWLIENAVKEAQARGDEFNEGIFKNTTLLKDGQLTQADADSMNSYLFDPDWKDIGGNVKPITKPVTETQDKPDNKNLEQPKNDNLKKPYFSEGKLISKKSTEIGTEYKVEFKSGASKEVKVIYSQNPNLVIPTEFKTEADFNAFKEKADKEQGPIQPKDSRPSDYGKNNKIFKQDQVEADRQKLRDFFKGKSGKLLSITDPEVKTAAMRLAGYHLEAGARKFADFAKAMIEDIGDEVAPYLRMFYESSRFDPRVVQNGWDKDFTPYSQVADIDVNQIIESLNNQEDVLNQPRDGQRDSEGKQNDLQGDQSPVPGDRGNVRNDGKKVEGGRNEGDKGQIGIKGIDDVLADPSGEQGDIGVRGEKPNEGAGNQEPVTGNVDGRGNSIDSPKGTESRRGSDNVVDSGVKKEAKKFSETLKEKREAQKKAESIPNKIGDIDNIGETLPYLLPDQQMDVFKAETRFFGEQHQGEENAYGKGILFTNGTGTGKTYTGLGIIKRFLKEGKKNILLVTPSQEKVSDFIGDGQDLGITISKIENKKDNGKGKDVVMTSFANFRDNQKLLERDWDLIVYDESHRIMGSKNAKRSSTFDYHQMNANTNQANALRRLKKANGLWDREKELSDKMHSIGKRIKSDDIMEHMYREGLAEIKEVEKELAKVREEQKKVLPGLEARAKESVEKTKVTYLSATPFNSIFNLDYAQDVLIHIPKGEHRIGHSRVDPRSKFYLDNFGSKYEWKYHRLQEKSNANPAAISMQETQFAEKLMAKGVMSGRAIDSDKDYARHFPLVTGFNSDMFNSAVAEIFNYQTNEFDQLRDFASDVFFDYNYSTQLFESMKASSAMDRIEKHIKLGRKAVVFHRRQQANVLPPFYQIVNTAKLNAEGIRQAVKEGMVDKKQLEVADRMMEQAESFESKFKSLLEYEQTLDYRSAVDQFRSRFGADVVFFNGKVSDKAKSQAVKSFNDDNSNVKVIVIQEESGKEGISLHDTTGKNQRVLMSLSMPISPITALQVEGRIYRIGNQSDAIFEYPLLGLDSEIAHFGQKLNARVSTTENLAMGSASRDLLKSFSMGVLNSEVSDPNLEQGKGGKEFDQRLDGKTTQFQKAILFYDSNQKISGRRDQREGVDFFPTPEPIGQKMMEWLNLSSGQKALEPSAGRGAIAMWSPGYVNLTAIEPSMNLYSKLAAATGGADVRNMMFEDLNIINKYDGIAMNPPFGQGGALAMAHLEKAFKHLPDGGRVVALLPSGPSMDKKLEKFFNPENKANKGIYTRAEISLPSAAFKQAGTSVNTKIYVFDKVLNPADQNVNLDYTMKVDFRDSKTPSELFDAIEFLEVPEKVEVLERGVKAENNQEQRIAEAMDRIFAGDLSAADQNLDALVPKETLRYELGKHTKTGQDLHLVKMNERLPKDVYNKLNDLAKKFDKGYFNRFAEGFLFTSENLAKSFLNHATGQGNNPEIHELRIDHYGKKPSGKTVKNQGQFVRTEVKKIAEKWNNGPEIEVYDTLSELYKAYPNMLFPDLSKTAAFFMNKADGQGGQKVIVIANHPFLSKSSGVTQAVLHEAIGHYGIRGFVQSLAESNNKPFLEEFNAIMQRVFDAKANDPEMQRIARFYFGKDVSELTGQEILDAAEEYLSHQAQIGVNDSWLDRAVSVIMKLLRNMGLNVKMTDMEMRNLIGNGSRFVREGNSIRLKNNIDTSSIPEGNRLIMRMDTDPNNPDQKLIRERRKEFGEELELSTGNVETFDPANPDVKFLNIDPAQAEVERVQSTYEKAREKWLNFREKYQDNMIRAKKLIDKKRGMDKVSDSSNFYVTENLAKGKTLVKTERFMKDLYEPLIETGRQMNKKFNVTTDEIGDYLMALHAPERNAKIKEEKPDIDFDPSGISDEEAANIVEAFESKVQDKELIDKMIAQVRDMNDFVNWKRFESGMISEEVYDQLTNMYENYVPLRGWEDFSAEDLSVYSPLKKAMGRKSKAFNPIPFMVTAAQEAIMKGENNKVRQNLLEFVKENPSPGDYQIRNAWYIKTDEVDESGETVWQETMKRPTKKQIESGEAMRSFDPNIHRSVLSGGFHEHVVPVMVNGKRVFIEFKDKAIPMAIKNLSSTQTNDFLNKLRSYTRWLSSMYTQYSPEFGLRNLIRDMGFGTFNILAEKKPKTAAKTIAKLGQSSLTLGKFFQTGNYGKGEDMKMLKEFMDEGALTGYSDLRNVKDIFANAQKEINNLESKGFAAIKNIGVKGVERMLQPLDVYNRTLENAMRFSYYKVLREQGLSGQKAAAAAKDLTVNFNRKGNDTSFWGSIYIFFNAAVQGNERLLRNFKDPKTRKKAFGLAGGLIGAGLSQAVLLGMAAGDDEDGESLYGKIPEYIRRTHIVIPVFGTDEFIKIPLPYGVNIFYAIGESIGSVLTQGREPGKEALGLLTTMSDSFSPIGGYDFDSDDLNFAQKLLQVIIPSTLQPIADLAVNRDFKGSRIYREPFTRGQLPEPNSQSYFPGVNPLLREFTSGLNKLTGGDEIIPGKIDINPEWIEYGIENYLGGPASFAKNIGSTFMSLIEGENILKDPNYKRLPFVRNYRMKVSSDYQAQQVYYENMMDANRAATIFDRYREKNDPKAKEFLKENKTLIEMSEAAKGFQISIKKINEGIEYYSNLDKTPESQKKIDELYDKRAEYYRNFNRIYNQKVKGDNKKLSSISEIL